MSGGGVIQIVLEAETHLADQPRETPARATRDPSSPVLENLHDRTARKTRRIPLNVSCDVDSRLKFVQHCQSIACPNPQSPFAVFMDAFDIVTRKRKPIHGVPPQVDNPAVSIPLASEAIETSAPQSHPEDSAPALAERENGAPIQFETILSPGIVSEDGFREEKPVHAAPRPHPEERARGGGCDGVRIHADDCVERPAIFAFCRDARQSSIEETHKDELGRPHQETAPGRPARASRIPHDAVDIMLRGRVEVDPVHMPRLPMKDVQSLVGACPEFITAVLTECHDVVGIESRRIGGGRTVVTECPGRGVENVQSSGNRSNPDLAGVIEKKTVYPAVA